MDTWVQDIFRGFFAMLDSVVYWFVELLISLFDAIAKLQLFNSEAMGPLSRRLFAILSIAMIFKVSFSIIQFIINPSAFSDAEKGMGKIVQNIILVLVCLVGAKYVFDLTYNLQTAVINSNIIPQIVLGKGESGSEYMLAKDQEKYKKQIPFLVASVFVTPNTDVDYLPNDITYDPNTGYSIGGTNLNNNVSGFGDKLNEISKQRYYYIKDEDPMLSSHGPAGTAFSHAYNTKDYQLLFNITSAKHVDNGDLYLFNYRFLISTAAGVFLVIMYVNFCIDLAIRTVKLGFLQLISPIPIISMIDPKSSKSGVMSKWVKNYISTYLGLFIRVAAVNFVIFTIDAIVNNSNISQHGLFDFITLVVIFGALMFAKEIPKLISDLTGIDLKGDFSLNPLKRVPGAQKALGVAGTVAGGVAAGALGFAGGFTANVLATGGNWKGQNWKQTLGNSVRNVGSILSGGFSGSMRGLTSKEKNPFKAASAGIKGSVAARNLRDERQAAGNGGLQGFIDRRRDDINNWAGIDSGAYDEQIKIFEGLSKFKSNVKGLSDFDKTNFHSIAKNKNDFANLLGLDVNDVDEQLYRASNSGVSGLKDYYDALQQSGATPKKILAAKKAYEEAQKYVITNSETLDNGQITYAKKEMANYISRYQDVLRNSEAEFKQIPQTYEDINKNFVSAMNEISRIKSDENYVKSQVNKRDSGK